MIWFFGFLVGLALEVAAFVLVAQQIGFLLALVILVVVSAMGPFIVRRVGLGVLAKAQGRLQAGEVPTREVLDGVLILAGGALICVPGFVGDTIGLLLMVGPMRHLAIRVGGRRVARRVAAMPLGGGGIINARSRTVRADRQSAAAPPEISLKPDDDPATPG